MKNASLTKGEVVDAIVDAMDMAGLIPLLGLELVIQAFAGKLGMPATKLARDVAARHKERFCCGDCENEGCHRG